MKCYHSALELACKAKGTVCTKLVPIKLNEIGKKKMYRASQAFIMLDSILYPFPKKETAKGGIPVYKIHAFNGDHITDLHPDVLNNCRFFVRLYKSFADMGISPEECSESYRDSLGGGWYSNVPMYYIPELGIYYALMECSHGMTNNNVPPSELEIKELFT